MALYVALLIETVISEKKNQNNSCPRRDGSDWMQMVQNWLKHRKCKIPIEKFVHDSNPQDLNYPSEHSMKVLPAPSLFVSAICS